MRTQRPPRALLSSTLLVLLATFPAVARAQTPIGGDVSGILGPGVYHTTAPLSVSQTLTLNAGVIIKFTSAAHDLTVDGTLTASGAAGSPVIFTSVADDSAGGDTNANGPSTGAPGSWAGVRFNPGSSPSVLTHTEVRYAGSSALGFVHPGILLNAANLTLLNCTVRDGAGAGLDPGPSAAPTVSGCTITNNGGVAVDGLSLKGVPGFSNNAASGNTGGNYMKITTAAVSSNLTISASSMLNGAFMLTTSAYVLAAATLTIDAGVVFKCAGPSGFAIDGTLLVNGGAAAPVIFTDANDDSAGGDTNGNGPSTGTPGAWPGLEFHSTSDASVLNYAEVRYAGYYGSFSYNPKSGVDLAGADITMTNCVVRHSATHGMNLRVTSHPTVTGCAFLNNVGQLVSYDNGLAVANAALTAVPGFTNNTASGNGHYGTGGDYIRVVNGNVAGSLTIGARSILGGALVLGTHVTVQPAGSLTVDQGVVVKFDSGYEVVVNGALNLKGTAFEPIVFTSVADDAFGGDTNGNGPVAANPGLWRGLTFNAGATTSSAENVVIRFPGQLSTPGLTSASPNVTLRSVRVQDAVDRGFALGALAATATNLVAWSCGSHGIHLTGGSFDLAHATVANCTWWNASGIHAEAGWTGSVVNSISYGSTTNYGNFGSGAQVSYSSGGFPGSNNNIDADPLFVNMGTGDLRLSAGSPCIDTAHLLAALAAQKDHDENSRILDPTLGGSPGADMGAYERAAWNMTVAGVPRIGTSLTFTVSGPPGESLYLLGVLDGVYALSPYGLLLAGAIPYVTVVPIVPVATPVGTPFVVAIVNDPGLIGLTAAVQTLTVPAGNPLVGNFTQLYRATARP